MTDLDLVVEVLIQREVTSGTVPFVKYYGYKSRSKKILCWVQSDRVRQISGPSRVLQLVTTVTLR